MADGNHSEHLEALKPGEDGTHITYCRLCEAQCGLLADVKDGKIVKVGPDRDHPVSRGHLCVKGAGMLNITYDPDRVLTPLKRVGGPGEFEPVSWDEALSDIAARITETIDTYGADAFAGYFGNPGAFNTFNYGYTTGFVGAFGSDKRFNAAHVDTGARMLASDQVFGHLGVWPFPDLIDTDMLLIFGGNPLISKMSLICAPRSMQDLDGIHARGEVIVIDPRNTETAKRYTHQPITPDTDVWLLSGMLKVIIDEGLIDHEILAEKVTGWGQFSAHVTSLDLNLAAERTGISTVRIAELARKFASADRAAVYGRVGTNRGRFSTLSNVLLDAINIATGNFAKRGGAIVGLTPFTPDGRRDPAPAYVPSGSRIGNLPLNGGLQPSGTMADEILTPGEGQIRAFFTSAGNPVMSHPDGDKMERALESLDLFFSIDIYVTETSKHAHYILPAPTFFERADINDLWASNGPEPWLHYVEPVIEPMGDVRDEYDIFRGILELAGKPDPISFLSGEPAKDKAEQHTPLSFTDLRVRSGMFGDNFGDKPGGLSLQKLKDEHPHGYKFFDRMPAEQSWDHVAHEDGKACFWSDLIESEFNRFLNFKPEDQPSDLRLFGRRLLHSMNSWMHNNERTARNSKPTLLMHPTDARDRQITDGQLVNVRNKSGSLDVRVEVSEDVVPGAVNYPHGFGHDGGWTIANELGGANINRLASSDPADFEPSSANCHLDGVLVEVTPLSSTAK